MMNKNMLEALAKTDPQIYNAVQSEIERQEYKLEMIASENFVSTAVLQAAGSVLTNKYAEGYPGKRYYGGCEYVDQAENLARDRVKILFNCDYANVQPHSGSQANMAVYFTYLNPGATILGMNLAHGGHLTHGSPVNFSGRMYKVIAYGVKKETGRIDMDEVRRLAREYRPAMIVVGASAYSRFYEFDKFRDIADEVNGVLFADIAHPAGLIATGLHPSPLPYCDIVTSTTHKTLRGPRGGLILMGKDVENKMGSTAAKTGRTKLMSELIDSMVMPGIQGGPLMHIIAAKAVAFAEALHPSFKIYTQQIIANSKCLCNELIDLGFEIVSGGTDNHLFLVDLTKKNMTGKAAEEALHSAGITVNKNMIPFDTKSPMVTSGIRVGTAALTTKGMKEPEMKLIARMMQKVLLNIDNQQVIHSIAEEVRELSRQFPLYNK
jgi:glycine hydroxymethyltransferase